jgi:transcriptional repressor NrdR
VIKRSGDRQRFDRAKLRAALVRASHKRDVDPRALDLIVDRIEREAEKGGGELAADRIGRLCLEGLEPLDRGAFLQFAGTLPDGIAAETRNTRKEGTSGHAVSVRDGEDADSSVTEDEESKREESI